MNPWLMEQAENLWKKGKPILSVCGQDASLSLPGWEKSDASNLLLTNWLVGEGNGTPLQYSCLENPRDGEPWWAAIYRVAQSWTQLK